MRIARSLAVFAAGCAALSCLAPAGPPGDAAKPVEFPGVVVDRERRQVRVACTALGVEAPLEFFCVLAGGPEHESVFRTSAKPSHIHAGLLMLGLEPGSPARYSEAKNAWTAPFGPPLRISVEWTDETGKPRRAPAERLIRGVRDKRPAPRQPFIFAGSHQRPDGAYLADLTGYVASLVNFEHTLIDVSQVVSSANETLEWEVDPAAVPRAGTAATMILEPVEGPASRPAVPAEPDPTPVTLSPEEEDARAVADEQREVAKLRERWRAAVKPHEPALQEAAKTHYEVLRQLRARQQKLIDEADRLQLLIDELEREYQALTTPQP